MKRAIQMIGLACALAALGAPLGAAAEQDMPVVVDQPLTEADLMEMEAQRAAELTRAQQLLIDLGYLTGRADGIAGPRTEAALVAFQGDRGLAATGTLDGETLDALEAMAETVENAKAVQERLIELGFLRGQADGIFGERSQAALRLFQTLEGLEATGKLDDATWERLSASDAPALPGRLSGGDKGDEVKALQERLIQLGFLEGRADGSYGKKTAAAVSRFQRHLLDQGVDENLGVEATGEATPITRLLLSDEDYSSYLKDVYPGEESEEVARVERRLGQLGYMDAQADEAFDDYAVSAARAFQSAAGLTQGEFDRAFIDALFDGDAPEADHFVLHAIAYGDRGAAVLEVAEALSQGGMSVKLPSQAYNDDLVQAVERLHSYLDWVRSPDAELFEDPGALSVEAQQALLNGVWRYVDDIGEAGEESEVLRVQRRLHVLYYLSKGYVDGLWGKNTADAVREFQRTNGLAESGVADLETQRALFTKAAICKQYPYRVEVDIASQRVYVFQLNDGGEYEQVQTFVCSTGLGNTTPRGIFLNGFPVNRWHYFEKFDCWAQYSFDIEGDIMFHSVLYSEKDTDTLRKGSVYALGSKASHGCVRLAVKDARWLFEHCKRGSLVILIY